MSNSRKTPRLAAAIAVAACMVLAFAALGGVGLAQTSGGPGEGQYGKKVTVCHKGKKTLSIGKPALPAHLRHGDQAGTCAAVAKAKKAKAAKIKAAKVKAAKVKAAKVKAAKAKAAKAKAAAAKAKAAAAKAKAEKAKAEKSQGGGKGKGKGK